MSTHGFVAGNLGTRAGKLKVAVVTRKYDHVRSQGYGAFSRPIFELVRFHTTAQAVASACSARYFVVSHLMVYVTAPS